jgi:putative transcriptional regulator
MKSGGTIRVTREPGDPPLPSETDWKRIEAATEADLHEAALADPDAQPLAEADLARMRHLVNVKKLRERIGLSQEEFARRYRIPVGTLRDWEQRRKRPDAPARAYLEVIDRDPATVAALLDAG